MKTRSKSSRSKNKSLNSAENSPSLVKVGLVQMHMSVDPQKNIQKASQKIREARAKGAQIVCLPELFSTEYFCRTESKVNFKFAEPVPNPMLDAMSRLAKELKVVILVPFFEKRAKGLYHNSCAVIDADGKFLGLYRKMHIPDDPSFYEKYYFAPGDLGFKTFDTAYGRIGVLICWDQWYPEGARLTALQGANILFYPTAIGWHKSEPPAKRKLQRSAWQTLQRSHAIANGVYVAAVNRVGVEKSLKFWGTSFVSSPEGEILSEGPIDQEKTLIVNCDLQKIELFRQEWPFLRDRRIDAYKNITSRFSDGI